MDKETEIGERLLSEPNGLGLIAYNIQDFGYSAQPNQLTLIESQETGGWLVRWDCHHIERESYREGEYEQHRDVGYFLIHDDGDVTDVTDLVNAIFKL